MHHHNPPSDSEQLLDAKGLAKRFGVHISYVYAMKRKGFRFVARRTTFQAAWRWLESNGSPRAGENRKVSEGFGQSR